MAEKRSFECNFELLRTIFQPRALSSDIPASQKGVYLFYNPPSNFSRLTPVDRSCIFCGIFRVSRYRIVNQLFIYPSLAFAKIPFWFSFTNLKFSFNVRLFLGFPSIELKPDDGYQIVRRISSDNDRPILYLVISFIQCAEIIR